MIFDLSLLVSLLAFPPLSLFFFLLYLTIRTYRRYQNTLKSPWHAEDLVVAVEVAVEVAVRAHVVFTLVVGFPSST